MRAWETPDDYGGAWLGICRVADAWGEYELLAAVRCNGREGYEAALRPEFEERGWRILSLRGDALPAARWLAMDPDAEAKTLAQAIEVGQPLALGQLRPRPAADAARDPAQSGRPWLTVRNIFGIEPFGSQIGGGSKKTIPDGLQESLFGVPASAAALEAPSGDNRATPLKTYAILDAAKVPLLPDLLETSGLAFRCLFKGAARQQLGTAAPYLVELRDGNGFVRRLFTDSDRAPKLWQSNCAVYLRSEQGLDEVVRHLRKLYLIRGNAGESDAYLRFWAPETLRILQPVLALSRAQAAGFFSTVIASVIWRRPHRAVFTQLTVHGKLEGPAGLVLDAALERRFARAATAQRVLRLLEEAEAEIEDKDPQAAAAMRALPGSRRLCHARRIDRLGIRSHQTAAALLSVIYLTGMNILQEPAFHYATRNPFLAPEAKARQMLVAYAMIAKMTTEE